MRLEAWKQRWVNNGNTIGKTERSASVDTTESEMDDSADLHLRLSSWICFLSFVPNYKVILLKKKPKYILFIIIWYFVSIEIIFCFVLLAKDIAVLIIIYIILNFDFKYLLFVYFLNIYFKFFISKFYYFFSYRSFVLILI